MSRARSIRSSPLPINRSRWSRKRLRADMVNDRLHRLKKDSVHNRMSEPSLDPPFNLPVRLAAPCRLLPVESAHEICVHCYFAIGSSSQLVV